MKGWPGGCLVCANRSPGLGHFSAFVGPGASGEGRGGGFLDGIVGEVIRLVRVGIRWDVPRGRIVRQRLSVALPSCVRTMFVCVVCTSLLDVLSLLLALCPRVSACVVGLIVLVAFVVSLLMRLFLTAVVFPFSFAALCRTSDAVIFGLSSILLIFGLCLIFSRFS